MADSDFAERTDILRTVTFWMGMVLIFVKFALLQEFLTYLLQFNPYILYIFGIPAFLGVLVAGGIRRTLRGRPAQFLLAYGLWLAISVPFSSWPGGSFRATAGYLRTELPMMFIAGGLAISWKECRTLMKAVGIAAILNILASRIFAGNTERLGLEMQSTIGNPNDLAAHMLLTLPFLLFIIHSSKSVVLRLVLLPAWAFGMVIIFKTGSRGALLAMVAGCVFLMISGTNRQRIMLACLAPVALAGVLMFVQADVLIRIGAFSRTARLSAEQAGTAEEAAQSTEARQYLLKKAVEYAVKYPVFGVGVQQFASFEGQHNRFDGSSHGAWHNVHNSFLAPFTEAGAIAGIMNLCAYLSTFALLIRTHRKAKLKPEFMEIRTTVFYLMLGMICFCVAIFFLNFAYSWYLPALAGLAIALSRAAGREFDRKNSAVPQLVAG